MAVAGTVPLSGAGVSWSSASAGWWVDRPSAGPEPGTRQSRASEPPPGWWLAFSKRRAADGDDRAGRPSRPTRSGQRPPGASLDALLLLVERVANCELRIGVMRCMYALPCSLLPTPYSLLPIRYSPLAIRLLRGGAGRPGLRPVACDLIAWGAKNALLGRLRRPPGAWKGLSTDQAGARRLDFAAFQAPDRRLDGLSTDQPTLLDHGTPAPG